MTEQQRDIVERLNEVEAATSHLAIKRVVHDAAAEIAHLRADIERKDAALRLVEDALSRAPFSTQIWPNGTHPNDGITVVRAALSAGERA